MSREGYAPCYDGNGNLMALVTLSSGEVAGQYEYGAFGETVSVDGDLVAQGNAVRFSTKYWDAETGLLYYTHRYYEAAAGRWLSRDPIEERGGTNLYGMVGNDPGNRIDRLGLIDSMGNDSPDYTNLRTPISDLWQHWRAGLNQSAAELERKLLDLCPTSSDLDNGIAHAKRQCCTPENCRIQAKNLAAVMKKAVLSVGSSLEANGYRPQKGGRGNSIASQASQSGENFNDATEGYGLKCSGWQSLMVHAFDEAFVKGKDIIKKGNLCFGIGAVRNQATAWLLKLDNHQWVVIYGPLAEPKTLHNFKLTIDLWQ